MCLNYYIGPGKQASGYAALISVCKGQSRWKSVKTSFKIYYLLFRKSRMHSSMRSALRFEQRTEESFLTAFRLSYNASGEVLSTRRKHSCRRITAHESFNLSSPSSEYSRLTLPRFSPQMPKIMLKLHPHHLT